MLRTGNVLLSKQALLISVPIPIHGRALPTFQYSSERTEPPRSLYHTPARQLRSAGGEKYHAERDTSSQSNHVIHNQTQENKDLNTSVTSIQTSNQSTCSNQYVHVFCSQLRSDDGLVPVTSSVDPEEADEGCMFKSEPLKRQIK